MTEIVLFGSGFIIGFVLGLIFAVAMIMLEVNKK